MNEIDYEPPSKKKKSSSKTKNQGAKGGKERAQRKLNKKVIFNDKDEDKILENIEKVEKKMSRHDIEFVIVSLMKHFFFSNLSDDEL